MGSETEACTVEVRSALEGLDFLLLRPMQQMSARVAMIPKVKPTQTPTITPVVVNGLLLLCEVVSFSLLAGIGVADTEAVVVELAEVVLVAEAVLDVLELEGLLLMH